MRESHTYFCETCGLGYDNAAAAYSCEAQPGPDLSIQVGDYVGGGTHGWWGHDHSWTMCLRRELGENHSPDACRLWLSPSHPSVPRGAVPPGLWFFLPIWRVIALRAESGYEGAKEGHRLHRFAIILWTPRHANPQGERIVRTYSSGHIRPLPVVGYKPTMTSTEERRFRGLVKEWDQTTAQPHNLRLAPLL